MLTHNTNNDKGLTMSHDEESHVLPSANAAGRTSTNSFKKRFGIRNYDAPDGGSTIIPPPPMAADSPLANLQEVVSTTPSLHTTPETALAPTPTAAVLTTPAVHVLSDPRLTYFDSSVSIKFHLTDGTYTTQAMHVHRCKYALAVVVSLDSPSVFVPNVGSICKLSISDHEPIDILYQGVEVDIKALGIKLITFIINS